MVHAIDRTAERFMKVVGEVERTKEIGPLVDLFCNVAEVQTIGREKPLEGTGGVRTFWIDYLANFREVHTDFLHVIEGKGGIALEWYSEGVLKSGEPVRYRGVSILELEGGLIKNLRHYYDSAAFLAPKPEEAARS